MRPFSQVDVFGAAPMLGNPVAVVHDGAGLSTEQMQRFTRWTNLSEATFLLPPTDPAADYAVRIFTPAGELPFAGHPTLGTCHAWLDAGGRPRGQHVVQECGAGLVPIRRDGDLLAFAAPPRRRSDPLDPVDVEAICAGLGLRTSDVVDHRWCDNGPPWMALRLASVDLVRRACADADLLAGRFVGILAVPEQGAAGVDLVVRAFFPSDPGIMEDPVTGSLNAAIGQWLIEAGIRADRYTAAQGEMIGRAGWVRIERVADQVWVGGRCVRVLTGVADLR